MPVLSSHLPVNPDEQKTVYFARTNFRGEDRMFGIKRRDRRQHMYVIGKSGVGKSVLLKNLAIQDIKNGSGVAIVDPHGEFVEEVLASIPPDRINDVIYFNPSDSEYPIGFNVLEATDPDLKHIVASDLMGIFTKIWANVWSARMEYIMQNCVMALLDTPGTTLLGISRILVDKVYRAKIIANIKDPVVLQFWTQEFENYTDRLRNEAIVPIQNKVGQFLNTSMVRNIVGQPKSTFNVQDVMNQQKILLVNVSKGRIGEDNSALLGAMLITKIQLAAMQRTGPLDQLKDFYLYVDEFQNFSTDAFATVLSEARKYRLCLTVAHQYIGQLVTDVSTKVRDAVFGNTGTLICFRMGAADAEFLETEFDPEFTPADMVSLPNYHIYLKLMVDGFTSRPFSATTLPPIPVEAREDTVEKVTRVSRERYAHPRKEVEERIMRWSGMLPGGEEDPDFSDGGATPGGGSFMPGVAGGGVGLSKTMQKRVASASRAAEALTNPKDLPQFDAVCARCGRETKVNFAPDPRRPVYCKLCLPIIKSDEARGIRTQVVSITPTPQGAGPQPMPVSLPAEPAPPTSPQPAPVVAPAPEPAPIPVTAQQPTAPVSSVPRSSQHDAQSPMRRPDGPMPPPQFPRSTRPSSPARPISQGPRRPMGDVGSRAPRPMAPHTAASVHAYGRATAASASRQAASAAPISLSQAVAQDGTSFSGKRIRRKEVDLAGLRSVLGDVISPPPSTAKETPDAPEETSPITVPPPPTVSAEKGESLSPGQSVKF